MVNNWNDVSLIFKQACSFLQKGELIRDESFGLFEAMSAIEMMDPKMDAGMLINQSNSKITSLPQAIRENLLKVDDFLLEEKIEIVDFTLCNLVTWLDGGSLAQTLFTNVYLHDPNLVTDQYVKYFCMAILRIAESIRNSIIAAGVFEEEDFQFMTYNFKFLSEVPDSLISSNLKSVEDATAKNYRNIKSQLNETSDAADKNKYSLQLEQTTALLQRIKFIRCLFQLLNYLNDYATQQENVSKMINLSLDLLSKINETHALVAKTNESADGKTCRFDDTKTSPNVIGFEPWINQRLLPPTFPRSISIYSFASTVELFEQFLTQLKEIANISQLKLFPAIFEFAVHFSNQHQSVLLRSFLQLALFPKEPINKMLKLKEVMIESIQQFISPPILNSKFVFHTKELCLQLVDDFFNKTTPVFLNLVQILGHNKTRQREKFGHIFEELASLQEEADNLDRLLHSFIAQQKLSVNHMGYFGSWILYNNLTIMNLYLVSGLELELFSNYEFHYIYCYLSEIVLNWQTNTLTRAEHYLNEFENFMAASAGKPAGKKANKQKKSKVSYEPEIAILSANRHMYLAYYQSMKGFMIEGYILLPDDKFDCEEFRYNHRFSAFRHFTNPPLFDYHHYKERDDHFLKSFTSKQMFSMAQEHFEAARSLFDKHQHSSAKIAKNNFVFMKLLSSGLKKLEKLDISFGESLHFPLFRFS